MATPTDRELLGGLLFRASTLSLAAFEASVAPAGLTPSLARTLFALDEPAPMRALAERFRCDASNITTLADRLADMGLVERVPSPNDRRVKLLTLTEAGERTRRELGAQVRAAEFPADRLTAAERSQLISLLRKMVDEGDRLSPR